jgi:hypothetical protein
MRGGSNTIPLLTLVTNQVVGMSVAVQAWADPVIAMKANEIYNQTLFRQSKKESTLMKKMLLLPIACLAIATLCIRFTSADSSEPSCPGKRCAGNSQSCCCQNTQGAGSQCTGSQCTGSQCTGSQCTGSQCTGSQCTEETETVAEAAEDQVTGDKGKVGRGQGGPGRGMGHGKGQGMGRGPAMMGKEAGAMEGMREDMSTLHAMFGDRDKIKRKVTNFPDGAEAVTESDDEAIAALLREHVPAMEDRVVGNAPLPPMTFHPIFVELIKNAEKYSLEYEDTAKGIKVKYTAEDPYVVMLVQEHAKLVSRFIKNGMEEIHKPYTLPKVSDKVTK